MPINRYQEREQGNSRDKRCAIVRQERGLNKTLYGSGARLRIAWLAAMKSGPDKVFLDLTSVLVWGLVLVILPGMGVLWVIDKIFPKRSDPKVQPLQSM